VNSISDLIEVDAVDKELKALAAKRVLIELA
jgi:hypothetical protein